MEATMTRREFGRTLGTVLTAVAFVGSLEMGIATAQGASIRVQGRVEWIAGQTMVVAPDGLIVAPGGTSAINVDLAQVAQDAYEGLATGDRVAVLGTIARDWNRVIASSIERLSP
jgi:hypothetical protein